MKDHYATAKAKDQHRQKARAYAAGGAVSADERQDKAMIKKAVAQHEAHDHPGKKKTDLALKRGGDAPEAHARGGKAKPKSKGNTTNVVVMPHGPAVPPAPSMPPVDPTAGPPGAPVIRPPGMGMAGPPVAGPPPVKRGGRSKC